MSSKTRVFIGRLPNRASERDVEHFFRGYGRIREVTLKQGYGFVEFDESRDAEDAVYELNGKELCGERVAIEMSKGRGYGSGGGRGGYGGRGGGGYGGGGYDRDGGRGGPPQKRWMEKYGPPVQTRYKITVENLSTRCSWQDLKDMLREAGCEVTYADAHKKERNVAVVCFSSREDLRRATDKFQGKDINGRKIKIIDESDSNSRSRSRSRSPRSRTRSPPGKNDRSVSRSRSKSRSRSPS